MSPQIRVRFAPSPTGYLHIGGLRTALYDFLYAQKTGGKFILRIEDTDQARYVEGAVENLINSLQTTGVKYDEGPQKGGDYGPYFQSQRTDIYLKYVQELIEKEAAYPCFCTSEDLEKMKENQKENGFDQRYDGRCRKINKEDAKERIKNGESHVIRLKVPQDGEISFYDVVRDKVTFPWNMIDDQVLIKSDGFPTYHLANVVDDHSMEISHVIRGEEWLSSTPKHIFMYKVFGWKPPKWVHLPLILNPDRTKLSKRQGDVATEDFLKKGFLPEALLNFIALLGWHPSGNKEIFSLPELIKAFSFKRISKSGAVFDIEKLKWMNSQYLKNLDLKNIFEQSKPFLEKAGWDLNDKNLIKLVDFARSRVSTLAEIPEELKSLKETPVYSEENQKIIENDNSQAVFKFWKTKIDTDLNETFINNLIQETSTELNIKGKNLYFPLRLALYGSPHGPEIPLLVELLGKDEVLKRISSLIKA
ncbi:MAG: glutamate--tRNA ligase [Candidatus Cloacimonetes bacterium]|nr:glutamate--tRNA ligase [Candidatus Cloacimonadota bacterium]